METDGILSSLEKETRDRSRLVSFCLKTTESFQVLDIAHNAMGKWRLQHE